MKRISRFVIALAALLLNGADSFTVRASERLALSNTPTVAIDLTVVDDAPVAHSGVETTSDGTPVSGALQATDIDSASLTFTVATPPVRGAVTLDPTTGAFLPGGGVASTITGTITGTDIAAGTTVAIGGAAATIVVNSTVDAVDAAPGDGVCATVGGVCTLRAAVQETNTLTGADVITLPAGTYTLTIAGTGEFLAATGDLNVFGGGLTINGAGAATTIVDGGALDGVFRAIASLTLNDLTVQNGNSAFQGGCISIAAPANGGGLTLMRVRVQGCRTSLNGGGVSAGGSLAFPAVLSITDTTIAQNVSTGFGGGLSLVGDGGLTTTISRSTISGNVAGSFGGGINASPGTTTIANSTISGNTATAGVGGGISFDGVAGSVMTLANVTINANSSGLLGDAVHVGGAGQFTARNTIVATVSGLNCAVTNGGVIPNLGNNLEFPGATCGFTTADPLLAALASNGGFTQTHALGSGSPAIGAGDATTCAAVPVSSLDQRGTARPFGANCAIGAFEPVVAPTVTAIAPSSGPAAGGTNVTMTGTNFRVGATVAIGGVAATSVVVVNATTITATTGAHAAGTVDVVVTTPGAPSGTLGTGFTYAVVNNPPAAAPVAQSGVVTTSDGTPVSGTLQATDIDSVALTFTVATPPARGAVTLDPATGAFTYTPNAGAFGYDPFTFNVSDGTSSSSATEMVFVVASSPRWPGQTVRASVASGGAEGNASSILGAVSSADGRFIAVNSKASNLVAGDTNGADDVFVHDRQTGQTTRVSVASDGTQGNDFSMVSDLSPDGRHVTFTSLSSNLVAGDTNGTYDAFVHDRQTGQTTRISVASDGTQGNRESVLSVLSANGRYVAFYGSASNLVAGDTNDAEDVFLHDRQTGQTTLVSVSSTGAKGNSNNWRPSISADGRFIAFNSESTNLVAGDTNGAVDGFVRDRQTGQTTRVTVASDGSQGSFGGGDPRLSADGRYVSFVSGASNLVAGDTNGVEDVFVRDRQTGQTTRVSVASTGAQGNGESTYSGLSADGRHVVIQSSASNLVAGDTNGADDVFVHDRQTGATRRVSVASDGSQGNAASEGSNDFGSGPAISADGRWIIFPSGASNLVASDTNATEDIFVVGGVSVSPTTVTVPGAGGARSVDASFVYPGTPWTATTADPWITVTTQSSTTGNGTVSYSVSANTTGLARTGTLTVATQPVTIQQAPATVPGAPTGLSGIPNSGQVSVSFTAPSSNGGAAITGYAVTASPGGATATGTGSPIVVSGLTNGTAYTFTATATNSVGTSAASSASAAVTPTTVPGAPTGVSGLPDSGQVSVSFTAPSSNGGAAITGYAVTASPGGATATGTGSPIVVTGLTNGTAYTFTATATNSVGTSAASSASAAVTPATVPGAPTGVSGLPDSGQVSVSFTAPSSNGGAAITGYTVTASPGGATGTGSGSPIVVTGLTNGTGYTFTVTATNSVGTGAASAASAAVTPIVPTITGAPATLAFSATKNGAAGPIVSVTSPQSVSVTYAGGAAPPWTATANQPWVQITNGTGTGARTFTVGISDTANAIGGSTSLSATITIAASSPNRTSTIALSLSVTQAGTSLLPFGSFDTPVAGASVAGSIAVTGWALDDVEVARVEIWRDRVAGETTPVSPGPGPGTGKIYIADPVFVTGARPDVEAGYPTLPLANRAGWGYLLLTQGLSNQSNGPFTLYAFAYDREGRSAVLGSKAITVSNATATRPFGTIDVPAYGQTMTGSFFNFGWALTPIASPTCTIGASGVRVAIDSGPLLPVSYGDLRTDIAAAFPGFSNGGGAGGAYYLDTTTLANGTHQIGWYVVDDCGRAEGIGSRFFTVLNGAADSTATRSTAADLRATDVALRTPGTLGTSGTLAQPIEVRRGVDTALVAPNPSGTHVVPIGQGERVEVVLPATDGAAYTGYQVVNGERRALPLGSSLDAAQGIFYWQPAAGFLGAHDLEFVPARGVRLPLGEARGRQPDQTIRVRAVVRTSVQAVIDAPRGAGGGNLVLSTEALRAKVEGLPGSSSFVVAGWAIDEAAVIGTGIDTVHVWAYPANGRAPIFLGVAAYGDERPDIGALFGDQFSGASYSLVVDHLPRGDYDIVVYPHSAVAGDFHGARVVRVTVR